MWNTWCTRKARREVEAVGKMAHPLHNAEWTVVPWDQAVVAVETLQALVVREKAEEDVVTHLMLDFPLVTVGVFLHPSGSTAEGFPHILQQLFTALCIVVGCRQLTQSMLFGCLRWGQRLSAED